MDSMNIHNLDIYNAGRSVPEEAQKSFDNGKFSGTDINPMWRIKKLTELFGPAGIGWYYEVLSERAEEHRDMTIAIVDLNLYVKDGGEWSKPIYGTGGNVIVRQTKNGPTVSDEGYKMALTDALSVACKALGIGADIYFSKDKTKYTAAQEKQEAPRQEVKSYVCADCKKPIEDYMSGGKVRLTSQDIAARSMDAYGRTLCMACSKLARMAEAGKSA